MTTPTDPKGGGQSDGVPYLPPSRPTATGAATSAVQASDGPTLDAVPTIDQSGGAPFVPAAAPAPPPAQQPTFDAKAMVDSQKRFNANPAYGALPSGTEASREASRKLREQAQRKRSRNKLLGRVLAVLLLVGVAAGGWFGYQAYQDEQDRNAAERAAAADDTDDPAALTPLGEQAEVVAGLDTLSDAPVGRAGGLGGAIDSARELVGDTSDGGDDSGADAPATADWFAARTVEFLYVRFETVSAMSPMVEYLYSYDRVADTYNGHIRTDSTLTATGTDAEYRFAIYPDGVVERVARSAASLEPSPDIALAKVFGENDVLPPAARPFATLVNANLGTDSEEVFEYTIDTEQWRDRDPGSFLTWVSTWHPRPADDPTLVDLERREVTADEFDTSGYWEPLPLEPIAPAVEWTEPGASVTFVVAADGHVPLATIVDNTADFRVEYLLIGVKDAPAKLDLGYQIWKSAP